tara:strand:- start:1377 stop:1913 length:537 start_codon:yes stop_codon:yes gene_type:complete
MWALVESNSITKTFNRPKGFTLGDIQYPASIFTLWSKAEKEAIGLYEIIQDNSNLKDGNYYINGAESITWDSSARTVTKAFASATAKTLADLKTEHKFTINSQAASILAPTDWMVVRAAEGGTAVPSDITTKRAAVRTKANAMCTQIDGAADVDALAALYVYNDAETPVRPLGELPTV